MGSFPPVFAIFCLLQVALRKEYITRPLIFPKAKKTVDPARHLLYILFGKRKIFRLFPAKERARAMFQKRILLVHPAPAEAGRLARLAQRFGPVTAETDPEKLLVAFAEGGLAAVVVDASSAVSPVVRSMVRPPAGVLITGGDEDALARLADEWPPPVEADFCRTTPAEPREAAFVRALGRIVELARLRAETADLRRSLGLQEAKVKDVLGEIHEIKGLLNAGFLR
jgi:hypothetical protein